MTAILVAEDWELDPLEPGGAAELYRRIAEAPVQQVPRAALAGHIGLTDRELHRLGCTTASPGVRGAAAMVGWRVVAFAGAVLAALGLATVVAGAVVPLLGGLGDPDPIDVPRGFGLAVMALGTIAGGGWLLRRAVRALRGLAARRRRAGERATSPINDRHGRATVAVLRSPGALRVQLLWLRGAAGEPAEAEVRVLAERAIEEDDGGRAEDAVAALSEIALRADAAHALRRSHGLAALGLQRRLRARAARRRSAGRRFVGSGDRFDALVDESWAPEALTDEGAAELARRVALAPAERWTAASLAPLLVERPDPNLPWPRIWPDDLVRERRKPTRLPQLRQLSGVVWIGCTTFVIAMLSGGDEAPPTVGAVAIGVAGLAAAALAWGGRRRLLAQHPALRLWRAARATAPGGVFAVARGNDRTVLLHVRAAVDDDRPGELEVQTLARRDDTDLETVRTLWTVADDARMRSEGVGEQTHRVRSLLARLGHVTAPAESSLAREPLAWIAALVVPLLLASSVKHFIAGTWFEDGVGNRVLSYAWPIIAAILLVRAARELRDPYARE